MASCSTCFPLLRWTGKQKWDENGVRKKTGSEDRVEAEYTALKRWGDVS